MSESELSPFYPNNLVCCDADLPFEDGTYEIYQRKVILNLFMIKNHRIQYHIVYNIESKKRLITWHFEYLNINEDKIHNIWRQPMDTNKCDLYFSSHWHLYPEEHKAHIEFKKNTDMYFTNFINHIGNCRENNIEP